MFASVFKPDNVSEPPSIFGPFYSLFMAYEAFDPTGRGEVIIYDLSRPVGDDRLYESAGRIFRSGRRFTKQEYNDNYHRLSQGA